jgi:hypothetical protein
MGTSTDPPRLRSDGIVQRIVARRRDDKHRIVRTEVQMLHVLKRVLLQSTSESDLIQNAHKPHPRKRVNERPKLLVHGVVHNTAISRG